MSNISFCQIWLFSLTAVTWCLYARLRVHHYERGGGQLSEWPAQEGSIKSEKESESQEWLNQKAGEKEKGEKGHPCRVPGISAGSPHLGFRRLLSKEEREGLFFTWARDNRLFVSQGGGVNGGVRRDAERGIKPRTHLHKGWGGGQLSGTGQMLKRGWFISLGVLGGTWPLSQILEWERENQRQGGKRGRGRRAAMYQRHLNTIYGHWAAHCSPTVMAFLPDSLKRKITWLGVVCITEPDLVTQHYPSPSTQPTPNRPKHEQCVCCPCCTPPLACLYKTTNYQINIPNSPYSLYTVPGRDTLKLAR